MRQRNLMVAVAALLTLGLVSFAIAGNTTGNRNDHSATNDSQSTSQAGMMGSGMMGNGTMGVSSRSGSAVESEAARKILSQIRQSQGIGPNARIDASKVTDAQYEALGDAWMDIMMPNQRQHEMMDQMMGGEGSSSLANAHRAMGMHYLSYIQNGTPNNMMMGGMMGMNGNGNMRGNNMNRMGSTGMMSRLDNTMGTMSQRNATMSNQFNKLETNLENMMSMNNVNSMKIQLQKQIDMLKGMRQNMAQQRDMYQRMMSMMNANGVNGQNMNGRQSGSMMGSGHMMGGSNSQYSHMH